ncbi:GNAT family N-acetyltransferase [Hydrogenophaga sp.]|uniref:GNAT family N-acetyltransferase n=1 Tax=Hydrogenophaga sp. TaxID=1904254 RepID=UPI0027348CD6|nr:GNAT family N-acetyltransferase [Hydrogenophaga sp.]MDP3474759.1 GNAT family N-acetyltransferase [Hydrogenophaga sp.]
MPAATPLWSMIETPRLTLRLPVPADVEGIHQMRSDPDVVRYVGGKIISREEAWQRLLRSAGHWSLLGYGFFMVIERASGRLVGEVGLMQAQRGLGERFDPFPEAGWLFRRDAQRKGYATEAVKAAHDGFFASRPPQRTVCIIDPDNTASLAVARKLGYTAFGQTRYRESIVMMLERLPG